MPTHQDCDFDWDRLRKRTDRMVQNKQSEITAGKPGEKPLGEYDFRGMGIRRMPEDEQCILRVSVGAGTMGASQKVRYCVFRGDPGACAHLLEEAAKAIRGG